MVLGMDSWFALSFQGAPRRLGISNNARVMLQALEDYKCTSMSEADIGRMLRLSPNRRQSMIDTIRDCTNLMAKYKEVRSCALVIQMCTEVLELANHPPPNDRFPFMKLPIEIRARVLGMIIDAEPKSCRMPPIKRSQQLFQCNCANPERNHIGFLTGKQWATYKILGRALRDEFYPIYYNRQAQYFTCCCDLLSQLKTNKCLRDHLRKAEIHWCGPRSDKAFEELAKCPNLKELTIKISKGTTAILNKREEAFHASFPLNYKNKRVTDSLGADELFAIRGIRVVDVQHVHSAQKVQLSDFDRQGLHSALEATVLLPKPEIPVYRGYQPLIHHG
ncbi:hypothetical protein CH063_04347 [Colletotrichum higginsianum]|uniref:Uncharacterized protein n=2 Tax=Colletotrichum higginsianum TaxID=80884 RepID=H1UV02_COLHI|nr:hypothetical protein CH63R_02509 [Colletotrichum higginsianum IMI 349063]OBR13783.1 hypothetical protein CH63R_02509 [Colletotrichum higginsianum IMI 349063]TID02857.1 hypothetical protein CH35J_003974 [Colletotrichum higginsianum]GJC95555.1 hypothetical protein ColKHC_04381 [Colletotrichum higginsianum]CCF31803.1 hypothetical protein CH063_04347 [Colletotrichum higginsianum]